MTKKQIKEIQAKLNADLPYMPPLATDGLWGPKSTAAAMGWQASRGLEPVGTPESMWKMMKPTEQPKTIFPALKRPFPRNIKYLAFHCSATQPTATVESMQQYWKSKGWKRNGYHAIVLADGSVRLLEPLDVVSNGVAGFNSSTVNICYVGGIDRAGKPKDTRTDAQKATLLAIAKELRGYFPQAEIRGHKNFPNVAKACPSFDAPAFFEEHGIKSKP